MREQASQGIYPGHSPDGYRSNKLDQSSQDVLVFQTYLISTNVQSSCAGLGA